MSRKKPKPDAKLRELKASHRTLKAKARRLQESFKDLNAAEDELRKHAALWVAIIRNRITALAHELSGVRAKCKPGTVLARVLDFGALNEVCVSLNTADCDAGGLTIVGEDLKTPDLTFWNEYLTTKLFPLANEGAAETAEGGKP